MLTTSHTSYDADYGSENPSIFTDAVEQNVVLDCNNPVKSPSPTLINTIPQSIPTVSDISISVSVADESRAKLIKDLFSSTSTTVPPPKEVIPRFSTTIQEDEEVVWELAYHESGQPKIPMAPSFYYAHVHR